LIRSKGRASRGTYRLAFEASALKEWNRLDGSIKEPLRKLLKRRLENPRVPSAALHGDLRDCYKIKLRQQGYRLVYRVADDVLMVLVLAVDRRDRSQVYEAALKRLREQGKAGN
jgi:mRNA interferase RelE/StbE